MRLYFYVLFSLLSLPTKAQKITGMVFNEKGDLLPYSSITIKGTTLGTSANNRAKFVLPIAPGTYTLVCQHIGNAAAEKNITVANDDVEVIFVLKAQQLDLKEVVVSNNAENPAYAIIREAIKKRPEYNKELDAFTCELYSKDLIKLRRLPKRIMGQKIEERDRNDMGLDTTGSGIIYLSESVSNIAAQKPGKFKMEVKSSRVSGSGGFGFTFPTFINLYNNNVIVFSQKLNPRGFISPIADAALTYYKYRYLGSFFENGKEINSIQVTPRRAYEPLFSGTINITEGDWRIHSFDLVLTKKSQLEIIDSLHFTQFHVPAGDDIWRVKNQVLSFTFSMFGIDAVGNFVNVYSNYNLKPVFAKNYFDRVIIKYDTNVNKRTKNYWDSIRPVPLEKEEVSDYQKKDSLFEVRNDSAYTKRTLDSLNKAEKKFKPFSLLWSGYSRTHYSKEGNSNISITGLLKMLEYNPAEGLVVAAGGSYSHNFRKKKMRLLAEPNIRYGTSNKQFNAWLTLNLRNRSFDADDGSLKRQNWLLAGGRRVTQFNNQSPITPLINSISTLLYGDNFMKTYQNVFGELAYTRQYENGVRIRAAVLYENRQPLDNTTNFTFRKKDSIKITPNFPGDRISQQFTPHKAVLASFDISFKPGQRYIQFPRNKIAIGSKWPTLSFNYTKGINGLLGSHVNFDRWRVGATDDMNFRIGGTMRYNIYTGGFFNNKAVFIQDFVHFNGNLTPVATDYLNSFQMMGYYVNSTSTSWYAVAHVEHHFNGLLTNKIPFFKKLNWNLVAGTNLLYVNERNNHVEVFAGLENIFKIFRIDFVAAYINGNRPQTAIRIGFGGLIGGGINTRNGGSATFSF
jgi:hypothetical protein